MFNNKSKPPKDRTFKRVKYTYWKINSQSLCKRGLLGQQILAKLTLPWSKVVSRNKKNTNDNICDVYLPRSKKCSMEILKRYAKKCHIKLYDMLRCDHPGGADQGWANSVHNPVCDRLLWNRPRRNLPRCQHQVPPPKVRSISICQFSSFNFNSIKSKYCHQEWDTLSMTFSNQVLTVLFEMCSI